MDGLTLAAAAIVVFGFVGIFLPALPGVLLVLVGIAVWAVPQQTDAARVVLIVATVLAAVGTVLQYVIPGRKLADAGVPGTSIFAGAAAGFVGFFVVPVAGLAIGFVGGIFVAELARLGSSQAAWPSTCKALAAVGWSILIEFATAMLMTATWVGVLIFTD